MVNIDRVRVSLTGFVGAPGVATHYGLNGPALAADAWTFWQQVAALMPTTVNINVENSGDTLNDATGDIVGAWSAAVFVPLFGGATGSYSAPSGCCVTWLTTDVVDSHRVRGRTFVVPMGISQYQDDGSLAPGTITGLKTVADALVANSAGNFVVWSRPRAARLATPTLPGLPARAGSNHVITATRVADKVAVLRSRRD